MKNNIILLSVGALALASCAPMMANSTTLPYTLSAQDSPSTAMSSNPMSTSNATAIIKPVGGITVTNATASGSAPATTSTTAKLTGLLPNTYYVAHYHLMGAASTSPCRSGGALIKSSMLVGQSDASGALTLSGSVPTNDLTNATYFNVHTASDAMGTPADAGISCTPIKF
ncbi:superoxide dismutase [Deinococcus altitudinis]|uniref:superoxide dismutase n=1 Tax=Deinococcus altitudinis TaxID=468914 RepID=UPI00389123E0